MTRKIVLRGCFPALAVITCCMAMEGCGRIGGTGSGGDDFGVISSDTSAAEGEMRGLPRVPDLPPVVPEAGGRFSAADVTGPRNPRVAWGVSLPFSQSATIQAVGVDGTVYVAGWGGVGAAREGKLLWAYHAESSPHVTMADDGRIWFPAPGAGGYFCLNRAGQGGLLPYSFRLPPDAGEPHRVGCSGSTGNGRWLRGLPHGDVALEYGCTRPQAKLGPDGMAYVGTQAPDIRAVTQDGATAWKLATPCEVQALLAGPGGRVVFTCKDLSIHYVENGGSTWTRPGDGTIDENGANIPSSSFVSVMDRNGTTYFVDHPAGSMTAHVHALTAKGEPLWTLQTSMFTGYLMQFDKRGRIYLAGMRGMHSWLVCISD